jgi:acetoin:2,6-dichlorophenolindophenol oxidoreductase subunit alpha
VSGTMSRNIDVARYLEHHRMMHRIRAFEEAAARANEDKLVLGAIHLSIGQEAIASGICRNLRTSDYLLSTHRGHGHTLAKGADATAMMTELLGREGGICQGKGGSMHIADFGVGMLGANGVVAANINIAAGAAHAIKLKREDGVSCSIFGDGAINRGPFLEGLNWAGVFKLPALFVCESNGFASTTRTDAMTSGDGAAARARSLGIPADEVDGNDIVAVDEVARAAVDAIRGGGGPRFILCHTYRLHGHTASDPAVYRQPVEVDAAWKNDPIERCAAVLREAGVDVEDLEGHRDAAAFEMDQVYEAAKAAPWPDLALAYTDVQDIGDPRERAF